MKKLLGISIVAVLAVTPLMANAAVVSVTVPETITATNDVASTSYVKGAHKELGVAINSLGTKVNTLETTVGDANSGLVKDTAALKTTVGDSTTGLVKRVADLESGSQAKLTEGDGINIDTTDNIISVDAGTGLAINSTSKALELSAATQASLEKADNAADKDLSNVSNAGKGVIATEVTKNAASGTYSSTGTYANDTIGKALQGKQDVIGDLNDIRSGAAAGATALQAGSALNGANLTAGTVGAAALANDAKALFDTAGDATAAKTAVETKLESGGANGYEINAKSLQVQGTDVLTTSSSLNGANLTAGTVGAAALADGAKALFDVAGAANTAEQNAKDYADAKLVNVHTTWGSDTVAKANVIVNPSQGG